MSVLSSKPVRFDPNMTAGVVGNSARKSPEHWPGTLGTETTNTQ